MGFHQYNVALSDLVMCGDFFTTDWINQGALIPITMDNNRNYHRFHDVERSISTFVKMARRSKLGALIDEWRSGFDQLIKSDGELEVARATVVASLRNYLSASQKKGNREDFLNLEIVRNTLEYLASDSVWFNMTFLYHFADKISELIREPGATESLKALQQALRDQQNSEEGNRHRGAYLLVRVEKSRGDRNVSNRQAFNAVVELLLCDWGRNWKDLSYAAKNLLPAFKDGTHVDSTLHMSERDKIGFREVTVPHKKRQYVIRDEPTYYCGPRDRRLCWKNKSVKLSAAPYRLLEALWGSEALGKESTDIDYLERTVWQDEIKEIRADAKITNIRHLKKKISNYISGCLNDLKVYFEVLRMPFYYGAQDPCVVKKSLPEMAEQSSEKP